MILVFSQFREFLLKSKLNYIWSKLYEISDALRKSGSNNFVAYNLFQEHNFQKCFLCDLIIGPGGEQNYFGNSGI